MKVMTGNVTILREICYFVTRSTLQMLNHSLFVIFLFIFFTFFIFLYLFISLVGHIPE